MAIEFSRKVIFTKTPLKKKINTPNFSLYPLEHEEFFVPKLCNLFPVVFEFSYDPTVVENVDTGFPELDELLSKMSPSQIIEETIILILTTCSNHYFKNKWMFHGFWGVEIDTDNPDDYKDVGLPKWCFPYFNQQELFEKKFIFNFSNPNISKVDVIESKEYFANHSKYSEGIIDEIKIPEIFYRFSISYAMLIGDELEIVKRGMQHLYNGIEIIDNKKTTGLLAIFTALETMVNLEYRNQTIKHCDTCGQPKYKVSKKFIEFLMKYVSKDGKKKFNALYSLRSKIVHAGKMMESETLFSDASIDTRRMEKIQIFEIIQYTRFAIVMWVCENTKEEYSKLLALMQA